MTDVATSFARGKGGSEKGINSAVLCGETQSGFLPARLEAAGVCRGFLGGHLLSIEYHLYDGKEKLGKGSGWLWHCQPKCFPEMPNCAPRSRQKRCSPGTCTVRAAISVSGSTEKNEQPSLSASWPSVLSPETGYIQEGCS